MNEKVNTKAMKKQQDEPIYGPWQMGMQRFRKNKVAVAGLGIFIVIILAIIFVPILSSANVRDFDTTNAGMGPSAQHWLGTDRLGRDIFYRLFLGGRVSLQVGLIAAITSVFFGSVIGGISGYYGGIADNLIMRFTELVASLPFLPFLMSLAFVMTWAPSSQKVLVTSITIGVLSWTGLARLVRGQILSLREQEFMQATEALGLKDRTKIFKHLIPNVSSVIIVNGTLAMATAILAEASLSFLGLGVVEPTPTWGNLMQLANEAASLRMPWIWMPAGVLCLLTVVSVNLIGEGLRDAFDPKGAK